MVDNLPAVRPASAVGMDREECRLTALSNAGKWDRWYSLVEEPAPYADTETYRIGAEWLEDCALVEDWGCGKAWLRQFIGAERYRGIDGSCSPFADEVVDLVDYRSSVPGVVLRHVLEHDYRWHLILDNALASAQERICVVLYTPLVSYTRQIDFEDEPGVPVLAFRLGDLTQRFAEAGFKWHVSHHDGKVNYKQETMIRGART